LYWFLYLHLLDMPCFNTVPISIIPPVSQGVAPLLWQNGNQITRLNIPLNPSFLVYDGTITRWGDGSAQAPVYLPNIQEVNGPTVTYVAGITSTGQLVKTIGASGTALVGGVAGSIPYQIAPSTTGFTAAGTSGQSLLSGGTGSPTWGTPAQATNIVGGTAGSIPYQTGSGATSFTAVGTSGQVLVSNAGSAPTWSTNINGNAATATLATTATTANGVAAGSVTPAGLSASVGSNAWLIKTTTYTALAGDRISADTVTTGAWTLTLPTSPASGTIVTISDGGNYWSTNNLTVAPGGANTINGVSQSLICNTSGFSFFVFYNGTTWRVLV
jgi:hypothetical protein